MKSARILAWLLIAVLLAVAGPAFGEELTIDMADVDILASGDAVVPEDVAVELPDALPDPESDGALYDAAGEAGGERVGRYLPRGGQANDVLFAGYVDMLFGGHRASGAQSNGYAGDSLTGLAAEFYNALLPQIRQVAEGELSQTTLVIRDSEVSGYTWDEASEAVDIVMDALIADCPYHLFWYNKEAFTEFRYDGDGLYISMPVAAEYGLDLYETDAEKIKTAHAAAANARKVVKKYAGVSDYEKLAGYRDTICAAVSYNEQAGFSDDYTYGDPWQLIWVFDGDDSTNVVCEGYAKAFQYLCELSAFSGSLRCYGVSGYVGMGSSHMWNIVTMEDGKNYHVDVTYCDGGFKREFLVGATVEGDSYTVPDGVAYRYDATTLRLFPEKALKLSAGDYDPSAAPDPDEPVQPTGVTIVQGKSATLYMGNKLALKAKLSPEGAGTTLKWSSGKASVATVSQKGVVTPKKAGTAKITVKTANGKKAVITVKVVDAKSVKLKKGSTDLKNGKTLKLQRGKTMTLKAAVSPAKVRTGLTWKSNSKSVTVKNGRVTARATAKAGARAKITVTTDNGKSAYIYIQVK